MHFKPSQVTLTYTHAEKRYADQSVASCTVLKNHLGPCSAAGPAQKLWGPRNCIVNKLPGNVGALGGIDPTFSSKILEPEKLTWRACVSLNSPETLLMNYPFFQPRLYFNSSETD